MPDFPQTARRRTRILLCVVTRRPRKAPLRRAAPANIKPQNLSPAAQVRARRKARQAGRDYPNLVDNMQAAGRCSVTFQAEGSRKEVRAAPLTRRSSAGGLTAAGRRWYARKESSHLRPGVKKERSHMSPEEMRRKGSWAVRFYGRAGALPPLVDRHRQATRFALTATAWGEPVPRSAAAARRIAAKGRRLLTAYQATKDKRPRKAKR